MDVIKSYRKIFFFTITLAVVCFLFAPSVKAANVGDLVNFNVDKNYDASGNSQVPASLVKITSDLYFYVDTNWWNTQTPTQKNNALNTFDALSNEFTNKIYPTLISVYGSEWNPGIDRDPKITLLFESMNDTFGGYFRSDDEYSKLQLPDSNEREMIYLPISKIGDSQLKVFLAHEFVHLIVFNQKDKIQGISEEVWLSEAMSDYASTILGYDNTYDGSNLQRRVQDFLSQPGNSLTEWQSNKYDYAVESLFMHYLVDHYGVGILTDALQSKLVGIPSINEALIKNNASENFSQIFTDWTITVVTNNCAIDTKYCYLNPNLTSLKINSNLIFLPLVGNSSLTMNNTAKNWAGNWQKIIGGNGNLALKFSSFAGLNFQVPYLIYDKNNNYTINFLQLDSKEQGEIDIKDFGTKYNALVIIPTLQSKLSGFSGQELAYPYTSVISITAPTSTEDAALIQSLQNQIEALKKQIAAILAQRGATVATSHVCTALNNNLYIGVSNTADVFCLQQFLASQGGVIYPQGLVTGTFGSLTKAAVVRFQTQYALPATGFVGILTRQKINTLLQNGG